MGSHSKVSDQSSPATVELSCLRIGCIKNRWCREAIASGALTLPIAIKSITILGIFCGDRVLEMIKISILINQTIPAGMDHYPDNVSAGAG